MVFCVFIRAEDGFVMSVESSWSIHTAVADVLKPAVAVWAAKWEVFIPCYTHEGSEVVEHVG